MTTATEHETIQSLTQAKSNKTHTKKNTFKTEMLLYSFTHTHTIQANKFY